MSLIPRREFDRARHDLALLGDMCRANALVAVKRAGSGHLGSSFSAMDIVVHLFYRELNTADVGFDDPNRDVYFSSKGHDVPGLYAVLHSLGVIPAERLLKLRRLGGLQEGQNFEGLQAAAAHAQGGLWVIVDRNELQSDKPTDEILALGDLEAKLRAFGWHVMSCEGHDHDALARAFAELREAVEMPKALIAKTVKGKGVSFMEHPRAL